MNQVRLSLPTSDDKYSDLIVSVCIPIDEVSLLRQFIQHMERVRTSSLLQRGMPGFAGLTWDASGITLSAGECTDPELYELLHVLRPVTLEQEAASYKNVAAVIGRRMDVPAVRAFLKMCNRAFRDGEVGMYMQMTIDGQPLFDESILRLWLNGTQYHTDAEKAKTWADLERSLTKPNCRSLIISQLHSRVLALLNVDYIARQVILAHDSQIPP